VWHNELAFTRGIAGRITVPIRRVSPDAQKRFGVVLNVFVVLSLLLSPASLALAAAPRTARQAAPSCNPATGRWLSADSIIPDETDPQALNRYAYTLNNPLKYRDPSGHAIVISTMGIIMATKITAGALATTVPYTLNAMRTDSFAWSDFVLNAAVGGFGGFMVGKGGLVLMGAKGRIATRAGKGIISTGGLYSVGNLFRGETFDKKDFVIESGFGGITPGVITKRGADPGGAAIISAIASSAESIMKDLAHGRSIGLREALLQAPLGGAGSLIGDAWHGLIASLRGEPNEFMEWLDALREKFRARAD
jgi:hypothetical protein